METVYGRGSVKFIRVQNLYLRQDRMVALVPPAKNQTKPNLAFILARFSPSLIWCWFSKHLDEYILLESLENIEIANL